MDSWDLTKLVARRWRISLPILLATVVLSVLAATAVKPTYVYTAYVQLVPPMPAASIPGQQTPVDPNPWVSQGLSTIGNAALISVQNLSYLKSLKARGYSSKITAQMGGSNPLATFTITGVTRAQASSTADQVADQFDANVTSLQTGLGLKDSDLISARRLDGGTNLAVSNSRVKRAVIAVAGLGLIMTITLTIAADAMLRRRDRRTELAASLAANEAMGSAASPARGTAQARDTARPEASAGIGLDSDVASRGDDSAAPAAGRARTTGAADAPAKPAGTARATSRPVGAAPTVSMPTAPDKPAAGGPIAAKPDRAGSAADETVLMPKPVAVTEE